MSCTVRIIGSALGEPTNVDECYLVDYDPHYGIHGKIEASPDRAKAKVFADAMEFFKLYRTANRNKPLRPDGKPNRPITAYHLEVEAL